MRKIITPTTRAKDLKSALHRRGYRDGPPPWLRTRTQLIDCMVCRVLRCGRCRKRGLEYKPYHKPGATGRRVCCPDCRPNLDAYVVLATCPQCGYAERV